MHPTDMSSMSELQCDESMSASSPLPSTSATVSAVSARKRPSQSTAYGPSDRKRRTIAADDRLNVNSSNGGQLLRSAVYASDDRAIFADNRALLALLHAERLVCHRRYRTIATTSTVQPSMRGTLLAWLYDVCKITRCEPDVFVLAVSYTDRYMMARDVDKTQLQLLACAALLIASKLKAPKPLTLSEIAYYTAGSCSCDELMEMEIIILNELNWNISTPSQFDFLDHVYARVPDLAVLRDNCKRIINRIVQDYHLGALKCSMQAALALHYAAFLTQRKQLMDLCFVLVDKLLEVELMTDEYENAIEMVDICCFHKENEQKLNF